MKKLRWQLVIILLTGLVVGFLLVTQQSNGIIAPVNPEPSEGGVYTEGLIGSLTRLNPLLDVYNPVDRDVNRLLFSGLVRFDSRGLPQPDLAETWGISQDGTIYNVSLRSNAVWHDGQPVTVDDVLFTIEMMRADDSPIQADLRDFWKEVEVKRGDERNIQFLLPEAFAPFLDYLTFGILPQHLLGDVAPGGLANHEFNLQPVGTGPYRFDHLIVENNQIRGVVLNAFDKHYQKKPYIQQIVFRYYPDADAVLAAYNQGEIQGLGQVPPGILGTVLAEPGLSLYASRQPEMSLVLFNLNSTDLPYFKEKTIRQALIVGLNRQWMVDHVMGGQAILADGPLFPGTWAYFDGLERISYDPDKAIALLKEAGYVLTDEGDQIRSKEGVRLAFTVLYPEDPLYQAMAEAIQRDWLKLGVQVTLEALPYDQLVNDRLGQRNYQAALVSLNLSRSPDPDPYPFWDQAQATGGQNYTQWDDRNASEYLERARITVDSNERAKLYRNFQLIFMEEMPALPLFYPVYNFAIDRQVQGVQMGPLIDPSDRFATVADWFLVAKRSAEANAPTSASATPSP